MRTLRTLTLLLVSWLMVGCAGADKRDQVLDDLRPVEAQFAPPARPDEPAEFDGTLDTYVGYGLSQSPALRASLERWRSTALMVTGQGRLPMPNVSWGYFLRSVETRVGPQQQRIAFSQMIPWPSKLPAAEDVQVEKALAAHSELEASTLELRERVGAVYWQLWAIQRRREVLAEQLELVRLLIGGLQARVEVGRGEIADLTQLELTAARMEDGLLGLDQRERGTTARLLGTIGAPPASRAPVTAARDQPVELPAEPVAALVSQALAHPSLTRFDHLQASARAREAKAAASRYPDFSVGVEWVVTAEAVDTGHGIPDDSGKDAVMARVGLDVPIWQGSWSDEEASARAEQTGLAWSRTSAEQGLEADLRATLFAIEDTVRRVRLYERTLIPQAEGALGSTQGAFETGKGGVANILLAYRDLIELQLGWIDAMTEHKTLWNHLDAIAGKTVTRQDAP